MSIACSVFRVILGLMAPASDNSYDVPDERVQPRFRTTVQIVPWVEVNEVNDELIAKAAEGLRVWHRVTDTAIVSTSPGKSEVYRRLRTRVPGMRIVPGVKTWPLLKTFDSPTGWRAVARQIEEVAEAARETVVLLDNETAMKPYLRGQQDVSMPLLRESLRQLPNHIRIIWYPSIHGDGNVVQSRYQDVCRVVEEVCDVQFVDLSMSGPKSVATKWSRQVQIRLSEVAEKPAMPMLYFYGNDKWWLDGQFNEALQVVERDFGQGATAVVYPGVDRWTEAAHTLAGQLEPTGFSGKPANVLLKGR